MTLTIELPDGLADRLADVPAADLVGALSEFADRRAAKEQHARKKHSALEFAGVGAGRPGAIGEDVAGYIKAMRDEWDEDENETAGSASGAAGAAGDAA